MTSPTPTGLSGEICQIVRTQAAPYNEWPSVIRRRKVVVSVVLLIASADSADLVRATPETVEGDALRA